MRIPQDRYLSNTLILLINDLSIKDIWLKQLYLLAPDLLKLSHTKYCQAHSISQSLNIPLSLRDRDRADTIITLYHTTPHHTTGNFLSAF